MRLPITLAALLMPHLAFAEDVTLRVLTLNIWYGGDQVSFDQTLAAIRAADADIVGLQEPDGKTRAIAAATGYPFVDIRRHIISRFPLFDPKLGERTETTNPPYSIAGVDSDAVQVWAMVAPGRVIGLANTHLTSDPYGPEVLRDGASVADTLANESATRVPEAQALMQGLAPLARQGIPIILTGDFNTPSHLDWAARPTRMAWPTTQIIMDAGFLDTYRTAHPDPVTMPGLTWTAGRPWPLIPEGETLDRVDFIFAANARVLDATLLGEPGNPDVGVAIAPYPSDHRGVISTLSVTPIPAPAMIAVEPTHVRSGDSFLIRAYMPGATWTAIIVPPGGDATTAITGIADVALNDRPTIRLSTIGLPDGPYDALLLNPDGTQAARTRFSVTPPDGHATLTTPPIATGPDITLTFTGAPGYRLDWIGIYAAGEPSVYNDLGFAYTGARQSGSMTLPPDILSAPLTPGEYELRLMLDDTYQVQAIAPFTVR